MKHSYMPAARRKAAAIYMAGNLLSDEQAAAVPSIFLLWSSASAYIAGDRVQYGSTLYRCLQGHGAQIHPPDTAHSLWVRMDDPAIEWPEWRQPAGSTEAYPSGAKVSHKGSRWVSTAENNVWEPGVYGWEESL